MLNIKICLFVDRVVESLLHAISVARMNSLKYQLQRWLNRSIVFKDVVGFLRPVDFPAENTPAETARVAYALPFSQESLAAVQIRIEAGVLQRNRGLRSQHLQNCDPLRGEGPRSQIVLDVERANELRLFDDGQAQYRPGAPLPHILVLGIQ